MTELPVTSAEEIELIDILRVIWKWKYLILVGTLVFALLAGVISLNQPKVYRIDMVLQPPVAGIDSRGRKIYIDSPGNIKALIEAEIFNSKILDNLKNSNSNVSKSLKFKVAIPKNSDSLTISYQAANVDLAIIILDHLAKQLLREYNEAVKKYRNRYESELLIKRNQLSEIEIENKVSVKYIEKMRNRINVLLLEIEKIDAKIELLIDEQSKYISDGNKQENINATILYNNLIQQLSTMKTANKNETAGYFMRVERENSRLKLQQNRAEIILVKIRKIENEMNSILNIQVIKPPTGSRSPIRPKIKLNIMLAAMLGFFTMVFLAFLLEYIGKHKTIKKD